MPNVKHPEQLVMSLDHVAPASTVGTANAQNLVRRFASEQGIRLFDVGRGICHQVLVEEQHRPARPDRDGFRFAFHQLWLGVRLWLGHGLHRHRPGLGHRAHLAARARDDPHPGRRPLPPGVDAKDLALKICQILTIEGANYMAVEYHGLDWLPLEGRQTLASMAVEIGAKVGMVPPTGVVAEQYPVPDWLYVDPEASYARTIDIDLDALEPQVSMPHEVDQVVDLAEVAGHARRHGLPGHLHQWAL